MRILKFTEAIDDAIAQAMVTDKNIIIMGEDVPLLRRNLLVRFGSERVLGTPISESAFMGAGITAAMSGLHPIIELYMIDFVTVAIDALMNHAAKLDVFSGGKWKAPMVVRAPCGAGYGDGGQHGQALWGWLSHIPGLALVVPSTPADAGGLMLAALKHDGPVLFMEHKLLSESWLEFLGSGGRKSVQFDVPLEGTKGTVPKKWSQVPFGQAVIRRSGHDITLVGVGMDVHRALEAAEILFGEGISAGVLDLRSVSPLDKSTLCEVLTKTGNLLVVDEDYNGFGMSGELAAVVMEAGLSVKYGRVCTKTTIPYARHLEEQVLPNVRRICDEARRLLN